MLSLVVACHNEMEVLRLFHATTRRVLAALNAKLEYVYVDDGSSDATWGVIQQLAVGDSDVHGVRLSRNFGKEAAILAGLDFAHGDAVVVIDADLQDPPELIVKMYEIWRRGEADVVYGLRRRRDSDSWAKRTSAALFYRLFRRVANFDVPANAGDFRLMNRQVVDAVLSLRERLRFSKGLFAWVGFRQVAVEFERPERAAGRTSWNALKLVGLALDGITSFSTVPLRVATLIGALLALVASIYGGFLVARTLVFGSAVPGYPSIMVAILFFSGLQFIFLGVIGEYLGRVFTETKQRPIYLVSQTTDQPMLLNHDA